ncbi:MAG: CPBP family intramembrane metalloprotease [Spirochaetales bacterium]|nr:CPBP family intramembrane metalloprotease [Spirochaetales bacterium]
MTRATLLCILAAAASLHPPPLAAVDYELTSRDILLNTLLPGYAQIKMGRTIEGAVYLSSLPLTIAGIALQTHYLAKVITDDGLERYYTDENGRWYVYYLDGLNERPDKWEFFLGTILGLYGTLLSTHSQYDVQQHLVLRTTGPAAAEAPAKPVGLTQALAAPWQPRNLLNLEILPVFALSVLPDVARLNRTDIADYFSRESVPFLGADLSPAAGLALAAGSAILIANANAVWEEIAYRGVQLQTRGIVGSSVSFGLVHLPNALVPNVSIQDTLWQATFATMFGLYAASVTERNAYDFRKAIAWHFWNNVVAFTLGYLTEPDDQLFFGVGVDVSW